MVSFVPGQVRVRISRKESGAQYQEIAGMIGLETPYAYHPVPAGTMLFHHFPDAYMITEQRRHSAVTGSILPADVATAEACIAYLVECMDAHLSPDALIERFAQVYGKWYHLSA